jgi:hypothetical protein
LKALYSCVCALVYRRVQALFAALSAFEHRLGLS